MQARRLRRSLAGLALAASLLLVSGCFDYYVELGLTEPGKGWSEVRLILPASLAADYATGHLDTLIFPPPTRDRTEREGRLIISERTGFADLDELAARRIIFRVEEIGTGVAGMGSYTYRITATLEMVEGDLPDRDATPGQEQTGKTAKALPDDPAARRARQLRARSLAGHFLTVSFVVPGKVSLVQPLVLGASTVGGVIAQDGERAVWKVPLSVLFNENWRETITLRAEFKGHMQFRSYEQKHAVSHYADAYDEALGRGENPPGGRQRYLQMHMLGVKPAPALPQAGGAK
ncbi:MAG: hypothetical protein V1797_21190 [Pseudomonadota bacterium]